METKEGWSNWVGYELKTRGSQGQDPALSQTCCVPLGKELLSQCISFPVVRIMKFPYFKYIKDCEMLLYVAKWPYKYLRKIANKQLFPFAQVTERGIWPCML